MTDIHAFAMATIGGAQALKKSEHFGSLEKGKSAAILAVESGYLAVNEVYSFLVHTGDEVQVKWLESIDG